MSERAFEATVQTGGRGHVFVTLPFDPRDAWGARTRHHVRGTVAGHPVSGSLGSRDGRAFLLLNAALRARSGIAPGDRVRLVIEPAAPAVDPEPGELTAELAQEPAARAFFDGLSPFYRNQYVRWITGAKRPATRASRLEQTVALLKAGRKQR